MPVAKAVNFALAPDGSHVPIDLFYTLDGPENGEVVVLISGLGAQLIHANYNTMVAPLVAKGYRVLRFDNRDSGLSTKLDALGAQGMVMDKLRNRMTSQNTQHQLNFPLDKKLPIHTKPHIFPENPADSDYTEFIQPGAHPHQFMIPKDDQDFSAKAPFPTSVKGGFWGAVGFGRKDPGYTLYDMAMDIVLLCNRLNIDTFHISGVSMGGMLAQTVSCLIPSRILSITLIMTTTGNDNHNAALKFLVSTFVTRRAPPVDAPIADAVKFTLETQMIIGTPDPTRTYNNGQSAEDFVYSFISRTKRNEMALRRQMDAIDSQESRDYVLDYLAARIPVLIFHGKDDQLVPYSNAPHMQNIVQFSLQRQLNPPHKPDGNRGSEPEKKELEIIKHGFSADDDRLEVTTFIGKEYNNRKIFATTAFLAGQAHDLPDEFLNYLLPCMVSHFDAAMGRNDIQLPKTFETPVWGTEKDLCFGAHPEPEEEPELVESTEQTEQREKSEKTTKDGEITAEDKKTDKVGKAKKDDEEFELVNAQDIPVAQPVAAAEQPVEHVEEAPVVVESPSEQVQELDSVEAETEAGKAPQQGEKVQIEETSVSPVPTEIEQSPIAESESVTA